VPTVYEHQQNEHEGRRVRLLQYWSLGARQNVADSPMIFQRRDLRKDQGLSSGQLFTCIIQYGVGRWVCLLADAWARNLCLHLSHAPCNTTRTLSR